MLRVSYNPNAYLTQKRNVRLGLVARSKILQAIGENALSIKNIGEVAGLKYAVVLYHLRLLEEEKIVMRRSGKPPYSWSLTGLGQRRLVES